MGRSRGGGPATFRLRRGQRRRGSRRAERRCRLAAGRRERHGHFRSGPRVGACARLRRGGRHAGTRYRRRDRRRRRGGRPRRDGRARPLFADGDAARRRALRSRARRDAPNRHAGLGVPRRRQHSGRRAVRARERSGLA
nr:hypothetical protein [Gammaproteobacteria bacterium]